jgi:hypothetical protein
VIEVVRALNSQIAGPAGNQICASIRSFADALAKAESLRGRRERSDSATLPLLGAPIVNRRFSANGRKAAALIKRADPVRWGFGTQGRPGKNGPPR